MVLIDLEKAFKRVSRKNILEGKHQNFCIKIKKTLRNIKSSTIIDHVKEN